VIPARFELLRKSEDEVGSAAQLAKVWGSPMTILHKDAQPVSLKGLQSEHHNCIDCGYNTFPGAPPRELAEFQLNRDGTSPITFTDECEVYMVREAVWKAAGMEPYGGCLCIGCLEKRIGRKLKRKDFRRDHSFNDPRLPCTDRLRDRRDGE